jgi:hypothetical protein
MRESLMRNNKLLLHCLALCLLALFAGTAAAQSARTLLWEARAGVTTVYLFGTIHVGRADMYPLPKSVENAWRASLKVALEADLGDQEAALTAMDIGMLPQERSLDRELPADLYAALQRTLAANGLSVQAIQQFKPFMLMLTLAQLEYGKLGYVPESGLDMYFTRRAAAEGKPLIGLETIEGQLKMMDGLSVPLQQAMLKMTIEDIDAGRVAPLAARLISGWQDGNAQAVRDVLDSEQARLPAPLAAEFHEKFLTERNRRMLAGIQKALVGCDTLFVAVGALHLIGPDSVTEMLAKKGFTLTRR